MNVHQAQQLVEFNFGETESIINGVKVKHTKFESEGYFKGYSVMIAYTKKADFSQIIVTHKNGLIYSVTLLKTNHDYILFE